MKLFLLFAVVLAVSGSAIPRERERIVGGSVTTISEYPFAVAMLIGFTDVFFQWCGGTILNNRSILTAAHCYLPEYPHYFRSRVGSTYASSGGVVHITQQIINHPHFNRQTLDNDICVLRVFGTFSFNHNVQPGAIAGPNYNVPDNTAVWAIGWGTIYFGGPQSEQLQHVQIWVANQAVCRSRYAELRSNITDNMMCAGWLDVGGRDACEGDSGGPLLHNNVVVGVTSFGMECALARFPGVFARVSRYTTWIQSNA